MKKTFFIIITCWAWITNAQTYSQVHWGNALAIGGQPAALHFSADTLITCSFSDGQFCQIIYRSFTRNGALIDSSAYAWDTSVYTMAVRNNSLEKLNDHEFISLNDIYYYGDSSCTQIIKLNNKLDTLKTMVFKTNLIDTSGSFDVLVEDTAITVLGHYVLPNKKLNLYIARFDTALNLQWYNTIADFKPFVNQYYNGYYPYRIRRVGNYYYIRGRCLYTTHSVEDFLVKTDLLGNKIWDKRYQYQNMNSAGFELLDFDDTLFMPSGFLSKVVGNTNYIKWHFSYLDTSGIILKDTLYPEEEASYQLLNAFRDANGNIFLCGHFYYYGAKSVVWKLDKNLHTVWRRVYYHNDYEDESWLYNIGQWPDGGIMAVGTYFDRYSNPTPKNVYLWLLSLDSNGCLASNNCGSDIGVLEWALPGQGIKIYPNPATDFINIELILPALQNTMATAKIYNTAGQVVLEQALRFVGGKAILDLADTSRSLGGVGGGQPWSGVLELQTETHLFIEKIIIQ